MRFDLFAGPFTRNDQFTVSPFTNSFIYLSDVPLSLAVATLKALNDAGANERRWETGELVEQYYGAVEGYGRGEVDGIFRDWLRKMEKRDGLERRAMANLTLGYVTQDVGLFSIFNVRILLTHFFSPAQV